MPTAFLRSRLRITGSEPGVSASGRRHCTLALALVLCLLLCSAATPLQLTMRDAARLDREGKCDESEPYYRVALAAVDVSPALLNNSGNHYLLCHRPGDARVYFERLLKINPEHSNANLQLARLAVNDK